MKKIIFFITMVLFSISAQAQTYNQSQDRVSLEINKLEKSLDQVKSQIYYLEVTLDQKLKQAIPVVKSSKDLEALKKEKYFASEDIINLKIEKNSLEIALKKLRETALTGTEYRTKSDIKSNIPEQMSNREYNRRSQSQLFKLSEGTINAGETGVLNQFRGVIYNHKTGLGENASFYITRIDIKSVSSISTVIAPGKKDEFFLPIGEYRCIIICGNVKIESTFKVDPRDQKSYLGEKVYWAAYKDLSDF